MLFSGRVVLLPAAFAVLALAIGRPAAGQMYSFSSFDVPGSDATFGLGINNQGTIVGGFGTAPQSGFVHSGGKYTPVSIPGSNLVTLAGINSEGIAVGDYFDSGFNDHGFLREKDGTITYLPDFSASASLTQPAAINKAGVIVGVYSEDPFAAPDTWHGFLFDKGAFTAYDVLGASGTQLTGINDAGQIVLITDSSTHSYLLDGGVLTSLDVSGAEATQVFGINNMGQAVGNYVLGGIVHGFLWSKGAFTTLDFPGSADTRIFDINDAGQMVGTYDGFSHGLIIQTVPEPGAFSLLIGSSIATVGFLFFRRRCRE